MPTKFTGLAPVASSFRVRPPLLLAWMPPAPLSASSSATLASAPWAWMLAPPPVAAPVINTRLPVETGVATSSAWAAGAPPKVRPPLLVARITSTPPALAAKVLPVGRNRPVLVLPTARPGRAALPGGVPVASTPLLLLFCSGPVTPSSSGGVPR